MDFQVRIPFADHLGIHLQSWDDGEAIVTFEPAPEHQNTFQVVHGGVSMTLLDVVMSLAARSVQKDFGAVTIEMKTSFTKAATGPLTAQGKLLHRTATMAFVQAEIRNEKGQLCAHATGTFKYIKSLVTGPRSLRQFAAASVIATD